VGTYETPGSKIWASAIDDLVLDCKNNYTIADGFLLNIQCPAPCFYMILLCRKLW
jgi:hypothetical protein